jgi:hypothetical protein
MLLERSLLLFMSTCWNTLHMPKEMLEPSEMILTVDDRGISLLNSRYKIDTCLRNKRSQIVSHSLISAEQNGYLLVPFFTDNIYSETDYSVKVKVNVTLQLTVSRSLCQGIEPILGLVTRYYFLSEGCFLKFANKRTNLIYT